MRKAFTPVNETREIADSDLDNVSGGILEAGNLLSGATSALPVLPALSGAVGGDLGAQIGPVAAQAGFSGGTGV
ncbi:type A2 lantipeptide [Streptomyces sp. NBC_00344]|uniref:type A2 lantipeptide n=1 Tax=Streptomyces sp. NBC_00344 TaxID=2975720 RepID=UPI002E249D8C